MLTILQYLPQYTNALYLNQQFLNREIQQHEDGHDSKEDALAALDLVKQMLEMKHVEHVDDDNNIDFDGIFDDCGGYEDFFVVNV